MGPRPAVADGGQAGGRRAVAGGRPALQLNVVTYIIGTVVKAKSKTINSDAHTHMYI